MTIRSIISTPIGNSMNSKPEDVQAIRYILNRLGYKDKNLDSGYIDATLDKNIRAFQEDQKLKVDGIIKPGGPTLKRLVSEMDDGDIVDDEEGARSPTFWCTECGGPHGGSKGDLCPDCDSKQ